MPKITVERNSDKKVDLTNNELVLRSIDRSRKDISDWRKALVAAESVQYPNRCRLYDLYEDVMLDGHLSGIIAKRIDAVLNKAIYFEQDGKRVPAVDKLIRSNEFRELMRTILQTPLYGLSGIEFLPGRELKFNKIPRKHIKPDNGLITYEQNGGEGIAYKDLDNVWVLGNNDDLGLLLKCAPYTLYKRGNIADWSQYIEIFGQPVRVVKYDTYDEQSKQQLKQLLDESGSSLTLMLPKQTDFEMVDGKQSNGDGKLHMSFVNALNAELSIIILGNTETTSSSQYSGYAQSRIHAEQQLEITKSDMVYVSNMLNSNKFLNVLQAYGLPVQDGRFTFARDIDVDELAKRIAIDEKLAAYINISEVYWHETYGITKALDK